MPDAQLARRNGVELVNAGSWQLLSGSWNPNRKDILAAVEAARCSAVRRPKLKLGHLDPRFNTPDDATSGGTTFDGAPSLGWFDNLRASTDGNTLIGDQVALPWLSQVQAAAYPDRSIEGKYNVRCALGHLHPFVVTAVSLLGETPPGIPTLKSITSLDDLPAALGVAAGGDEPEGGQSVQATIRAAAGPDDAEPAHTGAMIALIPTAEDAARLAVDGGEPADELHLTLAYLGEAADLGARGRQDVIDAVSTAVNGLPLLQADIFSACVFNPGDGAGDGRDPCLVWGLSGDMLDAVHDIIDDTLHLIDAPIPSQNRPWVAHITAAYTGDLGRIAELAAKLGTVTFDRLRLAFGGEFIDIPLMEWPGEEPDTADADPVAAAAGNPEALHEYWTVNPKGLAKWRGKPHPWTALYRNLLKFLSPDMAKRTASKWFIEVTGHTPNQDQGVKASEVTVDVTGQDALLDALRSTIQRHYHGAPVLPAAEPEPMITDPKEEDSVSTTDLSVFRSRLGLPDDADEQATLAALDALKAKAETPAEPTPELVAASAAAAEKASKAEEAQALIREELVKVRGELDTIKASAAVSVKASFFQSVLASGQMKPADRETWEARYDRDSQMVTEILTGRPEGSETPVTASGITGPAEPVGDDAEWESIIARIDSPTGRV